MIARMLGPVRGGVEDGWVGAGWVGDWGNWKRKGIRGLEEIKWKCPSPSHCHVEQQAAAAPATAAETTERIRFEHREKMHWALNGSCEKLARNRSKPNLLIVYKGVSWLAISMSTE